MPTYKKATKITKWGHLTSRGYSKKSLFKAKCSETLLYGTFCWMGVRLASFYVSGDPTKIETTNIRGGFDFAFERRM